MIDRSHALPIARQAKALNISRGSVYYLPRSASAAGLAIMRRIDELHLDSPFAGSRMLRDLLNAEGVEIGRLHVATLMKRMGIEAIYRKPNTSKRAPGHKIYPYLLRKTKVARSDHVWAMDITYIPMARGFVYLAAVVDWFQQARAFSSRVDHDGGRLLRRSAGGGSGEIRAAGDLQHRSRLAIHRRGLHRRPSQGRRRHQHGRQGLLARQCLCRKALAIRQVRGGSISGPTGR